MIHSLQAKLVAAFIALTLTALVVAGAVLVVIRKDDQEAQALNRVAALSPAVAGEILAQGGGRPGQAADPRRIVELVSALHGVRVLLLDSAGNVVADSGKDLTGKQLDGPSPQVGSRDEHDNRNGRSIPFATWAPRGNAPGAGLTFVQAPLTGRLLSATPGTSAPGSDGFTLVLAVPKSSVSQAWKDLVPALGFSAAVALPVAILLALLLANYITRPIRQLTKATNQLASGTFDIAVPSGRSDEFGDLARAFAVMAERVGTSQTEMRAMVANVSHDLKTPLTSIIGFSQAIRSGAVNDEESSRHAGQIIHEEATRLAARLQDILAIAELDAPSAPLATLRLPLGAVAGEVVERLMPQAEASGLQLNSWLDRTTLVLADRTLLERAIENLVANAIQHAPRGSAISVTSGAAENRAWLEVRNPAPGVEAEELPRFFERFYRRDRARKTHGSGLGLPIAREIIQRHGGSLTANLESSNLVLRVEIPIAQ